MVDCQAIFLLLSFLSMEITWYGQAAFKLKGKDASVFTDPYEATFTGLSPLKVEADIVTISHGHSDHNAASVVSNNPFVIEGPGEYELKGVNVVGVSTFHDEKEGKLRGKNTIYNINIDDVQITHLGDLGHLLTNQQLEELGAVDVLLIPVGGVYTIEADSAAKIVAQIEPKVVIPMHYKIEGLKFPLESVNKFLKEMGKEEVVTQNKLVVSSEKLPEELEIVLLEKIR